MLFVLPSDLEGLSLALLEAMGAGVCVLASDIPENREVVDGAGFLFKPGDVEDLEQMLRFLISDSAARTSAARIAKQRIQEQYQWNEITRRIEGVYFEVMGWNAESISGGDSRDHGKLPSSRKAVASEVAETNQHPQPRAG
jgi:rhamnosyl/mannosyltransferase